jgi:two-component system sensor histidine kinase HydH
MAHELRNPLASLKGHAQLLAEMVREGSREHAKALVVVAEAERLEALTRDLLAFVRDGEITRARVAPRSLIRRAIGGEADPRVAIDLTGAPENLWVDEARLAAALGNLVRNALQASEDAAAPVAIRITEGGGAVVIEVRDHGPGVLPGDEERIFEPFFTTRVHGTGLGLAVARRAVEQHDGTLRVEAAEGGGARFVATLPGAGDPP